MVRYPSDSLIDEGVGLAALSQVVDDPGKFLGRLRPYVWCDVVFKHAQKFENLDLIRFVSAEGQDEHELLQRQFGDLGQFVPKFKRDRRRDSVQQEKISPRFCAPRYSPSSIDFLQDVLALD